MTLIKMEEESGTILMGVLFYLLVTVSTEQETTWWSDWIEDLVLYNPLVCIPVWYLELEEWTSPDI